MHPAGLLLSFQHQPPDPNMTATNIDRLRDLLTPKQLDQFNTFLKSFRNEDGWPEMQARGFPKLLTLKHFMIIDPDHHPITKKFKAFLLKVEVDYFFGLSLYFFNKVKSIKIYDDDMVFSLESQLNHYLEMVSFKSLDQTPYELN
jgi:hypothetical protein